MDQRKEAVHSAHAAEPYMVVSALMATMRLHRKRTERFVRTTGLHPTQHRMLMHLSRVGSPLLQRELSEHFELTPAAVAQIIDKLESDGYVNREAFESDNRCKHIVLTEKGRKTAEESEEAFREVDAQLFANLSAESIDTFYHVLLQMQENLQEP